MDPVVVIQAAAPSQRLAAEMEQACTAALRQGACQLAPAGRILRAEAIAAVTWEGRDQRQVLVSVGFPRSGTAQWLTRRIEFRPEDGATERWRVVGLTIATLVGDRQAEDPQADEAHAEQTISSEVQPNIPESAIRTDSAPAPSQSPTTEAPPSAALSKPVMMLRTHGSIAFRDPAMSTRRAALLVAGGVGWDPTHDRYGPWLGAALTLRGRLFASLGLAYIERPRDARGVAVSWLGLSLGSGIQLGGLDWRIQPRLRLDCVVDRVSASVDDPASRQRDTTSRLIPGLRGGMQFVWPLGRWVAVVGGLDGTLYARPMRIIVSGERVSTYPALLVQLAIGAAVRF